MVSMAVKDEAAVFEAVDGFQEEPEVEDDDPVPVMETGQELQSVRERDAVGEQSVRWQEETVTVTEMEIKRNDTKFPQSPALLLAAREGHVDVVRVLLRGGADIHKLNELKVSVLHGAAESAKSEILEELLSRGADVYHRSQALSEEVARNRIVDPSVRLQGFFDGFFRVLCECRNPLIQLVSSVIAIRTRRTTDSLTEVLRVNEEKLVNFGLELLESDDGYRLVEEGGVGLFRQIAEAQQRQFAKHPLISDRRQAWSGVIFRWGAPEHALQASKVHVSSFLCLLATTCFLFFSAAYTRVDEGAGTEGTGDASLSPEQAVAAYVPFTFSLLSLYGAASFLYIEIRQAVNAWRRNVFADYALSVWNFLDAFTFLLVCVYIPASQFIPVMALTLKPALVVAGLFLSLRLLVSHFPLLLFLLLLFSLCAWLLAKDNTVLVADPAFESFGAVTWTLFNTLIGVSDSSDAPYDIAEQAGSWSLRVLIVVRFIGAILVLLNFLIALMASSYEEVQGDSAAYVALFRMERFLDVVDFPPELRLPPFLVLPLGWLSCLKRRASRHKGFCRGVYILTIAAAQCIFFAPLIALAKGNPWLDRKRNQLPDAGGERSPRDPAMRMQRRRLRLPRCIFAVRLLFYPLACVLYPLAFFVSCCSSEAVDRCCEAWVLNVRVRLSGATRGTGSRGKSLKGDEWEIHRETIEAERREILLKMEVEEGGLFSINNMLSAGMSELRTSIKTAVSGIQSMALQVRTLNSGLKDLRGKIRAPATQLQRRFSMPVKESQRHLQQQEGQGEREHDHRRSSRAASRLFDVEGSAATDPFQSNLITTVGAGLFEVEDFEPAFKIFADDEGCVPRDLILSVVRETYGFDPLPEEIKLFADTFHVMITDSLFSTASVMNLTGFRIGEGGEGGEALPEDLSERVTYEEFAAGLKVIREKLPALRKKAVEYRRKKSGPTEVFKTPMTAAQHIGWHDEPVKNHKWPKKSCAETKYQVSKAATRRQEKKKFNNFMFRLLIEAGEEDEQFFNIVDAETEKPEVTHPRTHHSVFAALENFYRKGKITELLSALVLFLKYIVQGETERIERLTAVDEKLSKTSKNGYKVDGFIQLMVYAGRLDTDNQEKIWRMVADLLNKNGTLPSLDNIRTEIQAMGAARAAAQEKKKESVKAENAGHEFGAAAVVKKKMKQQVQVEKDKGDESETDAPLCYKCGYFGHMRFECTFSKEEIRKKIESNKKKLSAGMKEKEKETKGKKIEARHVTVCSDDSEFEKSSASDSDDSYDLDELYF
uniref:CCHC-type domain-containing protein n=1 Tax=Chromera velia CCMP2878 TaxID=1169474 RepID=A0A0G4FB15_9ALVE|eukprot:Cvel_15996.t1-p1 / transcript=Cvel_15996.t1 / gene=Cvel_15996 / organism=Chromera_velia_CCMP2878 / gene_product=GA-binding protein subunit beta-1, putative / transcript_product=GA-binding protein subunit beta-1, putative / location=Cvel_scaffold1212:17311-49660(-) / protein_length=1277 / sequence_SO=supercontig / SO=protein_coding / is_pseudo=false